MSTNFNYFAHFKALFLNAMIDQNHIHLRKKIINTNQLAHTLIDHSTNFGIDKMQLYQMNSIWFTVVDSIARVIKTEHFPSSSRQCSEGLGAGAIIFEPRSLISHESRREGTHEVHIDAIIKPL
jgi:hypothetical protein